MSSGKPAWRIGRFSLRTGLAAFLVLGIGLGLVGRWYHDVQARCKTQLTIMGELPATRHELARFCAESKLKQLTLYLPRFDDDCLSEIANLSELEVLELHAPKLSESSLEKLASAKRLTRLIGGEELPKEALERVRKKLPNLTIEPKHAPLQRQLPR